MSAIKFATEGGSSVLHLAKLALCLALAIMTVANHIRNRIVTLRLSDHDHKRLTQRARNAGATTISAYIRHACLTGREFEMPPWAEIRALRNDVVKLAAAITATPRGPARDRAMDAATAALERIVRF